MTAAVAFLLLLPCRKLVGSATSAHTSKSCELVWTISSTAQLSLNTDAYSAVNKRTRVKCRFFCWMVLGCVGVSRRHVRRFGVRPRASRIVHALGLDQPSNTEYHRSTRPPIETA
jgi:hypothetical protein